MSLSRREVLKLGLKGAAAMVLALKSANVGAVDFDFDFTSLLDMTKFVVPDPLTLSYTVGGPCCKFCLTKFVVMHYQPVAFVEVTRAGYDSFASSSRGNPLTSTVETDGKQQHSFDARVWDLPQIVIDLAFGLQACRLCGKPRGIGNPMDKIDPSALNDLVEGVCETPASVVAEELKSSLESIYEQLLPTLPDIACIPKVLYDTSKDKHWVTGCRDTALASVAGPLCEVPGAGAGMTLTDWIGGGAFNPCVGHWGSVLPRQKQVLNHDIQTAAALTAYRAIHVAKHTWKTFPYDASLRGKLQQTIPNPAVGWAPGTNKLLYNSGRSTPLNGRWIFVWWVPVGCCKNLNEIAGLCAPVTPCI